MNHLLGAFNNVTGRLPSANEWKSAHKSHTIMEFGVRDRMDSAPSSAAQNFGECVSKQSIQFLPSEKGG